MTDSIDAILVPLDGSEVAERAAEVAASLPVGRGSRTLHLLSAVSPFPLFQPSDPATSETPGWFTEEGVRTKTYLEGVRERLQERHPGLRVEIHAPTGRPAPRILEAAEGLGAGLVVMTPSGRGRLSRAWMGSVADRVVRESPCPVLLLTGERGAVEFSSILVALDGSETSLEALEAAVRLAGPVGGRLTLASVIPRPESVAVPFLDLSAEAEGMRMDREAEMTRVMEELAAPLREQGLHVQVRSSRADEVAPGLLRLREQSRAQVMALGVQGRGAVERLVMGSVASRLTRSAPVPLLLVPRRPAE